MKCCTKDMMSINFSECPTKQGEVEVRLNDEFKGTP